MRSLKTLALLLSVCWLPCQSRAAEPPVRLRVERSISVPGTLWVQKRYDALDRLRSGYRGVLEEATREPEGVTLQAARRAYEHLSAMVAAYEEAAGESGPREEVRGLWDRIEASSAGEKDGPLPWAAAAPLVALEEKSLRRLADWLRQRAVERVGRAGSAPLLANTRLILESGGSRRVLAAVDLGQGHPVEGGRIKSPALRALAAAFRATDGSLKGSYLVRRELLWGRLELGPGTLELYADFSPAEAGGLLRASYREGGEAADRKTRLYLLSRLLGEFGFAVGPAEGGVSGIMDNDTQARTPEQMQDALAGLLKALTAAQPLDAFLEDLLAGAGGREARARRMEAWVVSAAGVMPVAQSFVAAERSRGVEKPLFRGVTVSPGAVVTARATYDPLKSKGLILVTPYLRPRERGAAGRAAGIVLTSGGRRSYSAVGARWSKVPAVSLGRAAWTAYGLRPDASRAPLLREGSMVRLDPAAGTLELLSEP